MREETRVSEENPGVRLRLSETLPSCNDIHKRWDQGAKKINFTTCPKGKLQPLSTSPKARKKFSRVFFNICFYFMRPI